MSILWSNGLLPELTDATQAFFRIAYGFQTISGIGDVNGDNVYKNLPPNNDPVTEVERSGFRYYIGLGTGW